MTQKMNLTKTNPVAMHNDLIKAKSSLSLNEIKLIRLTIMQVIQADEDLQTYQVTIQELAKTLGIASENLYHDINKMLHDIMAESIRIGDDLHDKSSKGDLIHWVSRIHYEKGVITIRLDDSLKPLLVKLKERFTIYQLNDILFLKSVYSIRLYELIREELRGRLNGRANKVEVYLSNDLIQHATATEGKYRANMFTQRVIIPSVDEINEKTNIGIESWKPRKEGRNIVGYDFIVTDYVTKKFKPNQTPKQ